MAEDKTPNPNANRIQFRSSEIKEHLEKRARGGSSANAVAERDLGRYYLLIAHELPRVAEMFNVNELSLLCDSFNGCLNDFRISPRALLYGVRDSIEYDQLDKKWEVDAVSFLQRLDSLNIFQAAVLIDAIERFWADDSSYIPDMEAKFKEIGLLKDD